MATRHIYGPVVGPENANFVKAYHILEDVPLTNKYLRSFGPEAPDTVFASNPEKTNQRIVENKKDYDLQKAMHGQMPRGPYYWQNPDGVWGRVWLADRNCNATYIPMMHCPFGGEYDPRLDNVMPHFEDVEVAKKNAQTKANCLAHGAPAPPDVIPSVEVQKVRVTFRTPRVFYDDLEEGEKKEYYVNLEEFRQCLYHEKANRKAFLAQTQKVLSLSLPIKLPIKERPTRTMQSLFQAVDNVRRSGRTRNRPNWLAGPKTLPTRRGPTKRRLFIKGPKGPTSKKPKKVSESLQKLAKFPNSVLKAKYKISRKEEDLKSAQYEALAGERELIKLGQDWDSAFLKAKDGVSIEATARVFFSLPYRSELARDMFKLICGNCTKQHLQYAAEKFHAVAIKSVREEYRAVMPINLVSPDKKKKTKKKSRSSKGPKRGSTQGPDIAMSKGPEASVPKGPKVAEQKGPKVTEQKGPSAAKQQGPKAPEQTGPKPAEPKGPKAHGHKKPAYHYLSDFKTRKRIKQRAVPKGPQVAVPKRPQVAVPKGPEAAAQKGPEAPAQKGPKAPAQKGPGIATPDTDPEFPVHKRHWIRSNRAKSGYKGVMACTRNPSTPWRAKSSSGKTLGRFATRAEACEAVYRASQEHKAQKQRAKSEADNPLQMWEDELKQLNY